jgi:hypothetical protein
VGRLFLRPVFSQDDPFFTRSGERKSPKNLAPHFDFGPNYDYDYH